MAAVDKISISIDTELLRWAKDRAEQDGTSLSALIGDALAERRRLEALDEVIEWLGGPASTEEVAAVLREWLGQGDDASSDAA